MSEPTPTDQSEECTNCKFAIFQDTGWSNYTTEGTEFYCAKHAHPDPGFDVFYETDPRLKYAAECKEFEAGVHPHLDVDGEWADEPGVTDEQKAIVAMWEAT